MVRETGHKVNDELLLWIRERKYTKTRCADDNSFRAYRRTCWRLRDRLSERDIIRLILAYNTGIATNELAEHFGINIKSARKLLREQKARRRKL